MRRILKRLSRGVVLKRRLPAEFGNTQILVTPESALSFWKRDVGQVDPFLLSMARQLAGREAIVWDIGANLGLFSFAAAALGSKVLAVEADTWLAHLLQRSVMLNKLPVTILPAAVTDTLGVSSLHVSSDGRASSSLAGSGAGQTVVTITLDWLLERFPPPQVLKIDVEGLEYAVLKGGCKLLELRPAIFCEVTENHDAIGQLLNEAGYKIYAARDQERRPLQRPSRDTLALPSTGS
jgi:FkbM family methyltransferase